MMNYERRFFDWVRNKGGSVETTRYDRSTGCGEVNAYRLSPPTEPSGVVVFLHGTGNDSMFPQLQLFQSLLNSGFEVFTFDLDGHGRESSSTFSNETIQKMLQDALSEAVRDETLPVHVIGYSLGGALALDGLANDGLQVKSLVVAGTPITIDITTSVFIRESATLVHPTLYKALPLYGRELLPNMVDFSREAFPIRLKDGDGSKMGHIPVVTETFKLLNAEQCAKSISTPTLYTSGGLDVIAPRAHTRRLHEQTKGSELYISPFETHFCLLMNHRVITRIIDFIKP